MQHRSTAIAMSLVAATLVGCVLPGDGFYQPMKVSGTLLSESGAPAQQRIVIIRMTRRKPPPDYARDLFAAPDDRHIIVTPDPAGHFEARMPGGFCSVHLWIVPPLGWRGCMHGENIAVGVDGSPPSLYLLHVTPGDEARFIEFARDAPPPSSTLTIDRFRWNTSAEKQVGPSGGEARLELTIVTHR